MLCLLDATTLAEPSDFLGIESNVLKHIEGLELENSLQAENSYCIHQQQAHSQCMTGLMNLQKQFSHQEMDNL